MKLTIEKTALVALLSKLTGAVERRNTIPVLSHVALYAGKDMLTGRATNLDIEVSASVPVTTYQEGSTTVPATLLATVASKMPNGALITLELKKDVMHVSAGKTKFDLPTLPISQFPEIASEEYANTLTIPSYELHRVFDLTSKSQSTEETKYYLNGTYLHHIDGRMRGVSTDGHRLSRIDGPQVPEFAGVIVPAKACAEVMKLLDAGDVVISVSDTKIRFDTGSTVLTSKVVDGTFPAYERAIPTDNPNHVLADAGLIKAASDRVAAIADSRTNGVRVQVFGNAMRMSVQTSAGTASEDEVEVQHDGADIDTGFNSKYLAEVLTNCKGQEVRLEFGDKAVAPLVIRPVDDTDALYVVMAMRI